MNGLEKRIRDSFIGTMLSRAAYWYYTRLFTPVKAFIVRRKERIKVLFVITELGTWKSEALYLKMLAHPRFDPMIMVIPTPESPDAISYIVKYLENQRFSFQALDKNEKIKERFSADIIFYPKPYKSSYYPKQRFYENRYALFCYVAYGFHNIVSDFICNQPYHNYVWQCYFENQSAADDTAKVMDNKGRNIRITGLPMEDSFRLPIGMYRDVWKRQNRPKKRIIWAPHHSFSKDSVLKYSTFLEYYESMLNLAEKYQDEVQFVFKPHPLLRKSLDTYWGKGRTDAYFDKWTQLPNAQVELGQYIDLFMTSDAMIHDCSSFTNEYMYTRKPVMYLIRGSAEAHCSQLNTHTKKAFNLHYFGRSVEDIEMFLLNVINGIDPYKESREQYYRDYLSPINGKSACDNIMDAILG